ncbi:toprim domain-containing protein [Clostridium beijerinckii]|uniref:toprim domain-containing protein n=1 Tax=Clostridium beijerinckii TaxID=1520 RepID=UPI00156F1BA5|nr:toprim domain-containing protein [Clostridium beijerinckii]NRU52637.1 DNA gyrase subunit B [Clostridium beijerinckii]NYC68680.1 DNA gyrase subunit B [Clostridium beijerinckii]NYC91829.1 DNA gyrase subunit B [Clostridium beijerinckii]
MVEEFLINEEVDELSDKEQARTRINLWHGSSNNYINMIKENIGNSLDVFNIKELNHIEIEIINSNKIRYRDSGRGIPVEGISKKGNNNYEAIFEHPFGGTKYGATAKTVGQNGIFLWSLAMTSEDIEINIGRPNGNIYNLSYHKGDRIKDLNIIGQTEETFTEIIFTLDREVWNNPHFNFDEVCQIAQGQSSLGNVIINVIDVINNLENTYQYQDGIIGYFNDLTSNKNFISDLIRNTKTFEETFKIKDEEYTDEFDIDFIFRYSNDSNDDIQKDFLNTADLIKHGTIQDGIILGLKNSIHKWLKNNNKYNKNEKNITLEDTMTGLNYICNVKNKLVEYENQIKQKTEAEYYKPILQKFVENYMEIFFIENPIQSELICNQVLINSRARLSADKTRQNIKKKLEDSNKGGRVKIDGLTDCDMKKSKLDDRFLLVVEGLSPKETVVEAYDNNTMGALGLRGRFISCLKKSVEEVLNNVPAYTLIQALGCGIEIPYEERKMFKDIKTFDKDNLRYGNIGILTDADCWGSGIRLALLTFIYKYLPTLLKENRIYIIISPRYEIKMKSGEMVYVYNDREKEQFMKIINEDDIYNIGIVKGIGEINKDDFWEKVLCPEAREKTFIRVNYDNIDEVIAQCFEDYMGEDSSPRKDFVKKFITNINLEEIN